MLIIESWVKPQARNSSMDQMSDCTPVSATALTLTVGCILPVGLAFLGVSCWSMDIEAATLG